MKLKLKLNFKRINWKLIYCFFVASTITIVLVFDFYHFLYWDSNLAKYKLYLSDRAGIFISFVTQQTNILVAIYFWITFFGKILNPKRDKIKRDLLRLIVTVYITITGVVFFSGLLPGLIDSNKYTDGEWVLTLFLHCINPILMIIYFLWNAGKIRYDFLTFSKYFLYQIYIYPLTYIIWILIRGELRHQSWRIHSQVKAHGVEIFDLEYPYWFLNYHHAKYGVMILVMAIVFILLLTTVLTYAFLALNNWIYSKKIKKIEDKK